MIIKDEKFQISNRIDRTAGQIENSLDLYSLDSVRNQITVLSLRILSGRIYRSTCTIPNNLFDIRQFTEVERLTVLPNNQFTTFSFLTTFNSNALTCFDLSNLPVRSDIIKSGISNISALKLVAGAVVYFGFKEFEFVIGLKTVNNFEDLFAQAISGMFKDIDLPVINPTTDSYIIRKVREVFPKS